MGYYKKCEDCGKTYLAKAKNARFCPECRKRRKWESDKSHNSRRKEVTYELSSKKAIEDYRDLLEQLFAIELGLPRKYINLLENDFNGKRFYKRWCIAKLKSLGLWSEASAKNVKLKEGINTPVYAYSKAICKVCGKEITNKAKNATLCDDCRNAKTKERSHKAYLVRKELRHWTNGDKVLEICEKELIKLYAEELSIPLIYMDIWLESPYNKTKFRKWASEKIKFLGIINKDFNMSEVTVSEGRKERDAIEQRMKGVFLD